jgi:hypothetical protein
MDARGTAAGRSDPFWSVVRRRHPDIDVVVLPPDDPTVGGDIPAEPDPSLADTVPAEFDAWLGEVWPDVAGDLDRPPVESQWVPGTVPGSLSRTAMLAVADVDDVMAAQALSGAARALELDGWHVLTPPDGMPRVLAGRDEEGTRRELQIVHVPATSRYAVMATLGPVVVGRGAARSATEDGV